MHSTHRSKIDKTSALEPSIPYANLGGGSDNGKQPGRRLPCAEVKSIDAGSALSHRVALVQRSALFSNILAADCANIVAMAHEKSIPRRQTIFFVGDPVQLWLLTSGCVKLMQVGPSGSEVILRLSGPGEVVGAFGLSSHDSHCSTAQALQSSKVLVWDAAVFESLSERSPVLRRNIMRILNEHLQEMEERFREISTERVASRLSSELVRLMTQVGRRVNGGVEIRLSREELAQLTGTTLYTVSRLLSQWEPKGFVKARREAVLICNAQALVDLAQGSGLEANYRNG